MSTFNGILEPFELTQRFILGLPESPINKTLKKRQKRSFLTKLCLISPDNLQLLLKAIGDLTISLDELWMEIPLELRNTLKLPSQKTQRGKSHPNFLQLSCIWISLAWASIVHFKNFFKLFESSFLSLLANIEEQVAIDEASDDVICIKLQSGEEKAVRLGDFLGNDDPQNNIQYKSDHSVLILPRRRV